MTQRLLAAFVGLCVLLPALIWGGTLAVEIMVPLAALVCLDEFVRMAFPDDYGPSMGWITAGSPVLYASVLYAGDHWVAPAFALVVLATLGFVTLRPGPALDRAADRVGRYLVGIGWIGGFFAFMPLLRRLDHGLAWVFLLLAIAWMGDTGGYFAGRAFGRHKLYERISPKKTWEGLAGGITLIVCGVFVVRAVGLAALDPIDCVVIGAFR